MNLPHACKNKVLGHIISRSETKEFVLIVVCSRPYINIDFGFTSRFLESTYLEDVDKENSVSF